jgi:hypothetical protein
MEGAFKLILRSFVLESVKIEGGRVQAGGASVDPPLRRR